MFQNFDAVLLDLDGTVYHEEYPLPGAVDLIRMLQRTNQRFACLSNSTTSPLRIMSRLMKIGVEVDPSNIYSAAAAAADHVVAQFGRGCRVLNLATEGIQEMLDGLATWVSSNGEPCDAVIVGAPTNAYATEDRLRIGLHQLRKKAKLVGICADRVYPSPRGIEFGCGALTNMLAFAANVEPTFCGKPNEVFFRSLCTRLQVEPKRCLLVGDNVEADILGGKTLGMATVLTLTGVTRRRDLNNVLPHMAPDVVVEDLVELMEL
jgi:HAD superfamily hydrolase (TIGR01450 family)